jgi:broad specificity phosphatase PhoE
MEERMFKSESNWNPNQTSIESSINPALSMTLTVTLNLRLVVCSLVLFTYETFRAIIESLLLSAVMLISFTEVEVVVLAGRSDEEFMTAIEDENDSNAHDDERYSEVCVGRWV